jgi:ADP-ribosylglycohydrolase
VLEQHGREFTADNVGEAWLQMLPVLTVFTAERIAYMNMLGLKEPPETASYRNPYREWIGAQIRGDIFGWVNPGRPGDAAAMAWQDAALSHVKNGIYGEMFVAAMLAGAFTARDVREAVEIGLAEIPPRSRLAEAIRFAMALPEHEGTWEGAVDRIYQLYGHYHWVHTINNAALLVAALLYGEGDYERTICNAVMGGWDTDCNGATVGSVLGVMLGASRLPGKWIAPLNNRVRSSLKGFDNITFDELARRTLALVPSASVKEE